ncbi:hypothetical protein KBZ10_18585 [Streptomyces sp. F63]|uniref:hypothetical protein n=1 Tax=Streptomyces sp. F63 TaxID=2824887 RepID=UPI001B375786|nr:hypothetical protein [Streptomyces sp. F63]MBQ0986484.1 hypothetical protein [Streptomyces sp. F63]
MAATGAFAGQEGAGEPGGQQTAAQVVSCPSADGRLPEVRARARAEVDRELAGPERQLAEANERLARSQGEGGPDVVRNAVLGPLLDKRGAVLDRIGQAIDREGGERPQGLEAMDACGLDATA